MIATTVRLGEMLQCLGELVLDQLLPAPAVQLGVIGEGKAIERPGSGQRLEHDHGERVQVRRRTNADRVAPLLGGHVRRRTDCRVVTGQPRPAFVIGDAACIDVGRIGVVEPGCELSLAQEALHADAVLMQLAV